MPLVSAFIAHSGSGRSGWRGDYESRQSHLISGKYSALSLLLSRFYTAHRYMRQTRATVRDTGSADTVAVVADLPVGIGRVTIVSQEVRIVASTFDTRGAFLKR